MQHVRSVLQKLLEKQLFVKAEKCVFHQDPTSFLGFDITKGGLEMAPAKVKAVVEWPTPRKDLQRLLGFPNFCGRSVQNYSSVAAPLTFLTSLSVRFIWSEAAEKAFEDLKSRFTSAPTLTTPDSIRQFIVEVDASDVRVGAVLHPCTFYSHRPSPSEQNYNGDRELLAVKLTLQECRHWLEGAEYLFLIWTDHRNLEYIKPAKCLNGTGPCFLVVLTLRCLIIQVPRTSNQSF